MALTSEGFLSTWNLYSQYRFLCFSSRLLLHHVILLYQYQKCNPCCRKDSTMSRNFESFRNSILISRSMLSLKLVSTLVRKQLVTNFFKPQKRRFVLILFPSIRSLAPLFNNLCSTQFLIVTEVYRPELVSIVSASSSFKLDVPLVSLTFL
jgi:hypothetical protein